MKSFKKIKFLITQRVLSLFFSTLIPPPMSSILRSLTSSLSTAVHEVLTPNKTYRCQLEDIILLRSDKSMAEGIGFKWTIHYKNKEGQPKTTTRTENFWLVNKEGQPGSPMTLVAIKNRLISLGVSPDGVDHFRWPWLALDGEHGGSALVDARKWFTATMEGQKDSEFLQLKIKDPQSGVPNPEKNPPPSHHTVQAKEAWERKQEKIKKREREEKEKVKNQEEPFEYADSSESEAEPEPPKKKKGKKAAESETPAPPKTPNRNRKVKTEPVTPLPVGSPSLSNYDFQPNSDFTFPPL